MQAYNCRACRKVSYFDDRDDQTKCPTCGGGVELLSSERVQKGFEAGAFYNIDPRTGKRAKPKRKK